MIYHPIAPPVLALLGALLVGLVFLVEVQVLGYAYRKIGVPPRYVFAVLLLSLLGAHVNIPLYEVPEGTTIVAINVGGALIPILVSIYLFVRARMPWRMLIGVAVVAVAVHALARIVPGVGIAVPTLLPPLVAVGVGLALAHRRAPPLAYVAGSIGCLIGADLWNLGQVTDLGAPLASIGGAGTFDGIFLTGIIAGLLA